MEGNEASKSEEDYQKLVKVTDDVKELKKLMRKLVPMDNELKDLMKLNNDREALESLSEQLNGVDLVELNILTSQEDDFSKQLKSEITIFKS